MEKLNLNDNVEMQVGRIAEKKLQIQVSMYSKLLEEFDQARQAQKENFDAEAQCSKSLPFPHQMKRMKVMRRNIRKRVEDTTGTASYMQQHNLFAYCEQGDYDRHTQLTNGHANPVILADSNGGTNLVDIEALVVRLDDEETSLERILGKIYSMQSQVQYLTARMDKVINENHGKFSDLDKLSLLNTPRNSAASIGQDPTSPVSDKVLVTSPIMMSEHDSEQHINEFSSIPVIPVTADQAADFPPSLLGTIDQPAKDETL